MPLPAGITIRSPPIRYAQLHEASYDTLNSRVITPEPSLPAFDPVAEAYQSSTDMTMIAASEPQPRQQTVSYAATVFALCLESTPFAQMMLKFQSLGLSEKTDSIASSHSQVRDGFDLVSFDKMSRIMAKSPRRQTSTAVYPSSTFLSQGQHTTTISLGFDVLHNLSAVLYILSNNLGYPTGPGEFGHLRRDEVFEERYQHVATLIKLMSERVPRDGLRSLLYRQQSTIKAAWESLLNYIYMLPNPLHLKAAFSFLLDMGIKLEWIDFQVDGSRILYYASLLESEHVPKLLRLGCRPNVFDHSWRGRRCTPYLDSYGIAITVSLSKGRVAEAKALIQTCDVNSAGPMCRSFGGGAGWPGPTAFQLFLHEFKPSDHIFHMGLALFLDARADVDINLCFCPESDVWPWYRYDQLKHNEQHTGVMGFRYKMDLHDPVFLETPYQFPRLLVSSWPSVTDYLFYLDREAFSVAAKHSRLEGNHVARASVLRALEVEPDTIRQYIVTRSGQSAIDMATLVQFLLFEQLAIAMDAVKSGDLTLIKRTCQTVRDLVGLVDVSQTQCEQGCVDLLSVILLVIREQPNDDYQSHLISMLEALLAAGAPMTSGAMARAVQLEGRDPGIILRFIPHMDNIRFQGIAALIEAAILNNFQAVDVLVDAGVDLNGPIPEPDPSYYLNIDHSVFACTLCFSSTGIEMLRHLIRKGAIPGLHAGVYDTVELLIRYLEKWYNRFDSDASTRRFNYIVDELIDVNYLASNSDRIFEACLSLKQTQDKDTVCPQLFEALLHRGAKATSGSLLAGVIHAGFSLDFVKSLLDGGLDSCVNSIWNVRPYSASITPLQVAASRGHLELVTMLVNRGADINAPARGSSGMTALQAICAWDPVSEEEQTRQMDIVRYLIHHAADINAPPCRDSGMTALQAVALRGNLQMASLLLQHGADINAPPPETLGGDSVIGQGTALDLAAVFGRLDMVKFLLNAGAISHRRGDSGYDGAIQAAEKGRYFVIADSIRRHAADNQTHGLINPELSRPPRDFREYDFGFEEENEEAESEEDEEEESEEEEEVEADADAEESGEWDTRASLGQLLLEIRLRAGMNW
ncbi:hypothetical protein LA080_011625 [Diaporthe eres]|nr:hypothetical protein LA080_011625 [Diaporthe eres]